MSEVVERVARRLRSENDAESRRARAETSPGVLVSSRLNEKPPETPPRLLLPPCSRHPLRRSAERLSPGSRATETRSTDTRSTGTEQNNIS